MLIGNIQIFKILMLFMIKIWGARGRKFESCHPDLRKSEAEMFRSFLLYVINARPLFNEVRDGE